MNRLKFVAKEVANEAIRDASEDLLSKSRDPNDDTVIDTAVNNCKVLFFINRCHYGHIYG